MSLMLLIQVIVVLAVIGVLLWAVNTYVPMEGNVKKILNAVVVIAIVAWLLLWLLSAFGIMNAPPVVR